MSGCDGFSETLLVIPCTRKKRPYPGCVVTGPRIARCLPSALAERLHHTRAANRERASINELTLVPAWQRYDGSFYQSARDALDWAVKKRLHLLILSGGYGVLLASEPIGCYDAPLNPCWWPERVLEDVLAGYAQHHRLKRLRAFIPAKCGYRPYREVVERVDWRAAGVDDAVIVTPDDGSQGGEAFAALAHGKDRAESGRWWCARALA